MTDLTIILSTTQQRALDEHYSSADKCRLCAGPTLVGGKGKAAIIQPMTSYVAVPGLRVSIFCLTCFKALSKSYEHRMKLGAKRRRIK